MGVNVNSSKQEVQSFSSPPKRDFAPLAKMGINIVVDLRGSRNTERKIVTHLGMQYVAMPWRCSFPKDETFAQFLTQLGDNPE